MASLIWLRLFAAGAIGFLAWRGEFWAMPLSLIVPCLIAVQPSRIAAGSTALLYYGAASLPVIAVSEVYWPSNEVLAIFLWFIAGALLALPWVIVWTRQSGLKPFAATAAVVLSAVPPLCIVGWASPLASAGVLFPSSGWFGIAAIAALPGSLIHRRTRIVGLLAATAASIVLNAGSKAMDIPNGWEAEMTRIHRSRQQTSLNDFFIENRLQSIVMQSQARFLVFPEGTVRHWTEATDAFWSPALDGTPKTVLVGAGQPIPGSSRYYNSVVVFGKEPREPVHQRIPVPGGMWNPLRPKGSFAADLFAPGTIDVGGQRAAIVICYEQLLAWPILRSAIERPTLLIAISNEAWTVRTVVPRVQQACARAWARLFGLPLISAINS
jgi:apolipoprotein N-acyltransferase